MITWTHPHESTHVTDCGRGVVTKTGSRYEATVDGEQLAYGTRTRKPYRYPTLTEAKLAAISMIQTGTFSTPTRKEQKYETYDPKVEGYGSPGQWQAIFEAAIGANGEIKTEELAEKLGVPAEASWVEIKRAYRKQLLRLHPDQGGDAAEFRAAVEAFEVLERRYQARAATAV